MTRKQIFRPPFPQMSTVLDDILQESVDGWNALMGSLQFDPDQRMGGSRPNVKAFVCNT